MILSPSPEALARDADAATPGEWEDRPDPSALYEIYWRYLWDEAAGEDQS